jgi:drug/metabolite transporter (DMT)-like permease
MSPKLRWSYAGVGALVALHWLTFYAAIKLSNASVAATCIALGTVFTALIEPWLTGKRLSKREVALGIAVLPGVAMVAGGVPDGMFVGILVGTVSAVFVALFGSLNKRLIEHADPLSVTALEMAAGTATLTVIAPLSAWLLSTVGSGAAFGGTPFVLPNQSDTWYLLLLAIGCTLVPFVLALMALRHLSAFATQLSVNLEPVYTIVLAALLLSEQHELTPQFYLGVVVILGAVLIFPLVTRPRPAASANAQGAGHDTAKQP